jgi:hypothetical protein
MEVEYPTEEEWQDNALKQAFGVTLSQVRHSLYSASTYDSFLCNSHPFLLSYAFHQAAASPEKGIVFLEALANDLQQDGHRIVCHYQ